MAKNDKNRLFSCCNYCSYWLSLSIVNSFLHWTYSRYFHGLTHLFTYFLNQLNFLTDWIWENLWREREREYREQNVCNMFLFMYVFIPAALVIEMSESILDVMNCDLQWTMAHPQYPELNFLRVRIVLILPAVCKFPLCGSSWWNKPRSRSEHSNILDKI